MSVNVYEMIDSMSGSVTNELESGEQREVRRRYLIGQMEGFNDVVREMELYAPQYVTDGAGLYWVRRRLDVNGVGHKYFDCTANYSTLLPKNGESGGGGGGGEGGGQAPQPGSLAWDTTGNTERMYQALGQTKYGADGIDPADFQEAINVNGSSVEGVDRVVPGMRYSETWIFPAELSFNEDYIETVLKLTGTVNSIKFRAFEPGEALFVGARCQWQSDQPFCAITFDFECRPNVEQFYVKGIQPFPKKGWEYVWIRYRDNVNEDTLVRVPAAAYKNKIYENESWAPLRIVSEPAPGRPVVPNAPANPLANRIGDVLNWLDPFDQP